MNPNCTRSTFGTPQIHLLSGLTKLGTL